MIGLSTQRFESFTTSANIGFASVQDIKTSDVYNTVTNKLKTASTELTDMVNGLTQNVKSPLSAIDDKINQNIRAVKDVFTTLQDMTKFSISDIENSIAGMLPGDLGLQNMFRNLTAQCRNNSMGKLPGFKPFKDKATCGKPGPSKCSTGEVAGFLSKLTGGAIGVVAKSLNSLLKTLNTLANLGYSGGLCKIFSALISGLPANIIQRGAAGLLASVGGLGNISGVMDIASSITGLKLNPAAEIPGLIGRITDNFKIPDNFAPSQLGSLYEGVTTSFGIISPGYDKSSDGLYSLAGMGTKLSNTDYKETASAYLAEKSSTASFDEPYTPADYAPAAAYVGQKYGNAPSLSDTMGYDEEEDEA